MKRPARDILFLLKPGFKDPLLEGRPFYCLDCAVIEGVLSSFPLLGKTFDIRRVNWPRPRAEVVAYIGEENQNLPAMVLAEDYQGASFIGEWEKILDYLSAKHGFPERHP
jgi:hypothetical protein